MSLLVMPTFAQIGVMFPIKQTPLFNTITQTPASGRGEVRIPTMFFPRWDFTLSTESLKGDNQGTNTAWQILLNFYMAVQGAASDWLFTHPYDNTISNASPQAIGTGDGTTVEFAIYRTLVSNGAQDLIQNFNGSPVIYVNGSVQASNTYTIDQYGNLTFNTAPPATQTVAWSGSFYYRCHFLEDTWGGLQEDFYQIWSINGIKFRSVLL